jgi:hypothetical protein
MPDEVVAAPLTDEQLAASFPGQDLAHVKAMMGKSNGEGVVISPNADGGTGKETAEPVVEPVVYPDYIPEKYQNGTVEEAHAAMAKGYNELSGKLGTETGKPDAKQAAAEAAGEANESEADDGEGNTTLTLAEVEAAYTANGNVIAEEVYVAYEAQGMPRETLDAYIGGQQAIADGMVTAVHAEVGGQEQYEAVTDWAEQNWTKGEVKAFNDVVTKGQKEAAVIAVRGLRAAYESAMGRDPSLVTGDGNLNPALPGYESRAQMTADMRDPKYKVDPAFRKTVEQKIANSAIW